MNLLGAIGDIYELESGMKAVLFLFFCRLVWIQQSIHTCFSEVRRCNDILEKSGEIGSRFEMLKGTTAFGEKEKGAIETDLGSPNMTEMKIKVFQLYMMFCVFIT